MKLNKFLISIVLMSSIIWSFHGFALESEEADLLEEHGVTGTKIMLHTDQWSVKPSKIDIDGFAFKGQGRSIIDWKVDHETWLDFNYWKEQRTERDKFPEWKIKLREIQHTELIGQVIKCFGVCNIYRGRYESNSDYMSKIIEGDEIITAEHSYAWVLMADGSLLRVSPKTSLTFNEVNIGTKDILFFIRLNHGHAHWQVRKVGEFEKQNLAETDLMFYPLMLKEANRDHYARIDYQEMNHDQRLLMQTRKNPGFVTHYNVLNEFVQEKNEIFIKKNSKVFLVMPNSTFYTENAHFDAFYAINGEGKFRYFNELMGFKNADERESKVTAMLRGYINREETILEENSWYVIDPNGKEIGSQEIGKQFNSIDLFIKRTPSIHMARELMMRKTFSHLFEDNLSSEKLATEHGYRLWDSGEEQEFTNRIAYLKEYTRRVETTNINSLAKVFKGKEVEDFDESFYVRALDKHILKLKNLHSKERSVLPELNELQYYIWILKYAKKE